MGIYTTKLMKVMRSIINIFMRVKDILKEVVVTQQLLYNPDDDSGPFDMTNQNGPFNMTTDPPSGEQEEKSPLEICDQCDGTGKGRYPGSQCRVCKGEGVIDNRE